MVNDFYNSIKKALDEVDGEVVESVCKTISTYQQMISVETYEDLAQPGRIALPTFSLMIMVMQVLYQSGWS